MVTNVQDDQMERAKDLMKETLKSNVNIMKKFDVEVKGLGSFGDRVVFAEVGAGADVLKELNKVFSAAFKYLDLKFTHGLQLPTFLTS